MSRTYTKKTAAYIKSKIKKGGTFEGFIVGHNVLKYHYFEGLRVALDVKYDNLEDFEKHVNAWCAYNQRDQGYPNFYEYVSCETLCEKEN